MEEERNKYIQSMLNSSKTDNKSSLRPDKYKETPLPTKLPEYKPLDIDYEDNVENSTNTL